MKAANPHPSGFRKILESLASEHDSRKVFDAFTRLAACALAAGSREEEYLAEAKHWNKSELELFAHALGSLILEMEKDPFEDLLGPCYLDFALAKYSQDRNGEFYTPKPVADLMANMLVGNGDSYPSEGPITVCDPACGSGGMILSFAEATDPEIRHRLRVTAIDTNRTACDMTFVNTTLWGIPTRVIHGDSLTLKVQAHWHNIHWRFPFLGLFSASRTSPPQEESKPLENVACENTAPFLTQPEFPLGDESCSRSA